MITFSICLVLLVVSYFTYGRLIENLFGINPNKKMPSETLFDGVDYVPLPKWKTFLIQLLNIAGLGPIFGAVLGATYGPIAFLWITLGGILIGGVHDFASGYVSVRNNGLSYPEVIGRYLGLNVKQVTRGFTVLLLLLVGAVFIAGPAGLLEGLTGLGKTYWLWIILGYYFLATMLPIDKIIGNIYPLFGSVLIFMALGLLFVLFINDYNIPELSFINMKADASKFPIIPNLFITIACGAISGFHATQSPMMGRCITNEDQMRPVFFGAMISESVIALIWAAIAMVFFGNVSGLNTALAEHAGNAAWVVDKIAGTTMGKIGGILVFLGVVAAPITTGDTAFRSARLIVADFMKIDQQKITKRLLISLPIFAVGYMITLMQFDILWRYFAWANQTLAVTTLWMATIYLATEKKQYIFTLLPALFMTFIVSNYMFVSPQMLNSPILLGAIASGITTLALGIMFFQWERKIQVDAR